MFIMNFKMLIIYIHQEMVTSEVNAFVWVCPAISSHAQTWLNFL